MCFDFFVCCWVRCYGILYQSEKPFSSWGWFYTVETKCRLIQIVLQPLVANTLSIMINHKYCILLRLYHLAALSVTSVSEQDSKITQTLQKFRIDDISFRNVYKWLEDKRMKNICFCRYSSPPSRLLPNYFVFFSVFCGYVSFIFLPFPAFTGLYSSNVCFIELNFAGQFIPVQTNHCSPQFMKDK